MFTPLLPTTGGRGDGGEGAYAARPYMGGCTGSVKLRPGRLLTVEPCLRGLRVQRAALTPDPSPARSEQERGEEDQRPEDADDCDDLGDVVDGFEGR